MSAAAVSHVWEHSAQNNSALLLLLALADCADTEGRACASMDWIAARIRTTLRQARRLVADVVESGELSVQQGAGPDGINLFQLHLNLPGTLDVRGGTLDVRGEDIQGTEVENSSRARTSFVLSTSLDKTKDFKGLSSKDYSLTSFKSTPAAAENVPAVPQMSGGVPQMSGEASDKADAKPKRAKGKTTLPDGFGITESMRKWAVEKGLASSLDGHLEYFIDYARSNGKQYADWEGAFRNCVRQDWGDVRKRGGGHSGQAVTSTARPRALQCEGRDNGTRCEAPGRTRDGNNVRCDKHEREHWERTRAPMPAKVREQLSSLLGKKFGGGNGSG